MGEFGPARPGDSFDALRSSFGEPPVVSETSRRHRTPGIWKYGDIEFHLTSDQKSLRLIFCDTFAQLRLVSAVVFDRWFFEGHPPLELVERELGAADIKYERHDMPHESSVFVLRLNSGIELLFSDGSDPMMWPGVPGLFGFQYAGKASANTAPQRTVPRLSCKLPHPFPAKSVTERYPSSWNHADAATDTTNLAQHKDGRRLPLYLECGAYPRRYHVVFLGNHRFCGVGGLGETPDT